MDIWIKSVLSDIALGIVCWYALSGNEAALNLLAFAAGFCIGGGVLMILTHKTPPTQKILRERVGRDYMIYDAVTDIAFVIVLASLGWYWMAGLLAFVLSWKFGIKKEIVQRRAVS